MSTTVTTEQTTEQTTMVNPESGVTHTAVEKVLGSAPRSKKNEPTVARSARFFFERAEANKELLVPVFDTQNIRPVKGADPIVLPVFSEVFKVDLDLATAVKVFESEANVVRMAIDYANGVILSADAVTVRTTELAENATFLEAKRFEDIRKARATSRGEASITPEWIDSAKKRIAVLVAQELELRKARKELDAEGEAEDNRGYDSADTTETTENDSDDATTAQQEEPKKAKKPGRK